MKNIILVIGLTALLTGCKQSGEIEKLFTGGLKGEKIKLDATSVAKGKKVFEMYCVACHQKDGIGKAGMAPKINSPEFLGLADNDFIKQTILSGRPGTTMMSFAALPGVAGEIDHLVNYVRSWQNGFATYKNFNIDKSVTVSGNSKNGKKLYATYCAACHGAKGDGYISGGSGPGIGLAGFLSVASDMYIKKTIEMGRAGTAMKPFKTSKGLAHLTDGDINDVVSYLRKIAK